MILYLHTLGLRKWQNQCSAAVELAHSIPVSISFHIQLIWYNPRHQTIINQAIFEQKQNPWCKNFLYLQSLVQIILTDKIKTTLTEQNTAFLCITQQLQHSFTFITKKSKQSINGFVWKQSHLQVDNLVFSSFRASLHSTNLYSPSFFTNFFFFSKRNKISVCVVGLELSDIPTFLIFLMGDPVMFMVGGRGLKILLGRFCFLFLDLSKTSLPTDLLLDLLLKKTQMEK